ncbi:MAG: hypothetical protein HQ464_17115 [Planctomycetes bacterium]|nr:hypothetical protein [Planctomycetota bacterium]
MKNKTLSGCVIALGLSMSSGAFADFLYLQNTQWHPSAGTAVQLTAGEYELTPLANPDGRGDGLSAFFSGGGWNSWQWSVAVWNSNDDSTHNNTNATRIAYFRTETHGNPGGYDTGGATEAFNAALAGERNFESTGYPGNGPYRFTIPSSGTYYFGIFDSDQTNNRGEIFADLHAVPAPAASALLALAGLVSRRRRS